MDKLCFQFTHKDYFAYPMPRMKGEYMLWVKCLQTKECWYVGYIDKNGFEKNEIDAPWDVQYGVKKMIERVYKYWHEICLSGNLVEMRKEKTLRNKELTKKRYTNPKKWTWGTLAKMYSISRFRCQEIYMETMQKYPDLVV